MTISDKQRETMNNNLIEIRQHLNKQDESIALFAEKFQTLARHLVGKPINGSPIDTEGGWCGRMTSRMDAAEEKIEEADGKMVKFELRTPTKRGLMFLFGACTAALGIIQAIAVLLVWAHK